VTLVSGPVALADPKGVTTRRVVSAADMYEASRAAFETCDAAIMTAAVCDYRPARKLDHKLKKQSRTRTIKLLPTTDIAASIGAVKGDRVLIAFAMEDHDHHAHAERKLERKNCDAIVLNGPENVGGDQASIEVLRAGGKWSRPIAGPKAALAAYVVELAEQLCSLRQR
jgi:phosphopantothenoylcysteine decarboxylase/phosphopantothenate--cysteine ligase